MHSVLLEVLPWMGMRDPFSTISHGVGIVLSLVGLWLLVRRARRNGVCAARRRGLVAYGVSLVLVFAASTLFHFFDWPAERLVRLKKLDHAAIFLLIAATSTVVYGALAARWTSYVVVGAWVVCLAAMILKVAVWPMGLWFSAAVYLAVGWAVAAGTIGLVRMLGWRRLRLFLGGCGVVSLAAVVFATEKPVIWPGVIEGHELFHLIVLVGVGLHFAYVYQHCCDPHPERVPEFDLETELGLDPDGDLATEPVRS